VTVYCSSWRHKSREAKFVIDGTVIPEGDDLERQDAAARSLKCGVCVGAAKRQRYGRQETFVPLAERADVRLLAEARVARLNAEEAAENAIRRAENEAKTEQEFASAWSFSSEPYFIIPQEIGSYSDSLLSLEVKPLSAGRSGWGPGIEVKQKTVGWTDSRVFPAFIDARNLSRMTSDEARKIAEALNIAADFADKTNKESAPNG